MEGEIDFILIILMFPFRFCSQIMAWQLIRPTEVGMKEQRGNDSSPEVNGLVYSVL